LSCDLSGFPLTMLLANCLEYFSKGVDSPVRLGIVGRRFLCSLLVGAVAGLGAIVFYYLLQTGLYFLLGKLAGFTSLDAAGERAIFGDPGVPYRRWLIPFVVTLGGLLSGLLVFTLAPEAEGHGTDTVIDAFHRKHGRIRGRVSVIKIIASALTMGSGGSGGREGPIALIAAGFGSFLGELLKLPDKERRILMCAGMGAGIGAIFRAPLAGALFAGEVLYRNEELEHEALIPATVASIVAYSIFGSLFGWDPLFRTPPLTFSRPAELLPYTALGVVCAVFGYAYIHCFYGTRNLFRRSPIPVHLKPALGGLVAGIIGLLLPQSLALGYGEIQNAFSGNTSAGLLLLIAVAKIVTTSFSIGSGGSGGVFGPAMVIGGCLGGAVGEWCHALWPTVVPEPAAFIIVGMVGFFAGAASTPISTLIMVSEMTGNYNLLVPSMFVCAIAFILLRRYSIYEKQVLSRLQSPAHLGELAVDVLQLIPVSSWMTKEVATICRDLPLSQAAEIVRREPHSCYPVVDGQERPVGLLSAKALLALLHEGAFPHDRTAGEAMRPDFPVVARNQTMLEALHQVDRQRGNVVVVVGADGKLAGIVTRNDLLRGYHDSVERLLPAVRRTEAGSAQLPGDLVVGEVMTVDFDRVATHTTLAELEQFFERTHHHGSPVVDKRGRLAGVVTIGDLERAKKQSRPATTVAEFATRKPVCCYPHQTLSEAMQLFADHDVGRLVVVDPARPDRPVGVLTRADVVHAYAWLVVSATGEEARTAALRLDVPGARFVSFTLRPDAPVAGLPLRKVELPEECLLVSVQHDTQLLIPHGDTQLKAGDRVTVLAKEQALPRLDRLFGVTGAAS